jgi:hypothetical protein
VDNIARWLRVIAFLLAVLVVLTGWLSLQLMMRPAGAQASNPVPVYIVDGPLGLFQYARVRSGVLDVQLRGIDEHPSLQWESIPVRVR